MTPAKGFRRSSIRFRQPVPPKSVKRYCVNCGRETKHIRYEPDRFGSKKSKRIKIYFYRGENCGASSSP